MKHRILTVDYLTKAFRFYAYLQHHQIECQGLFVGWAHDCQIEVDYGEIGGLITGIIGIFSRFFGHSDEPESSEDEEDYFGEESKVLSTENDHAWLQLVYLRIEPS